MQFVVFSEWFYKAKGLRMIIYKISCDSPFLFAVPEKERVFSARKGLTVRKRKAAAETDSRDGTTKWGKGFFAGEPRALSHELLSLREVQALVGGVVRAWFFAGFYVAFFHQVVDEGRIRCSGGEHFFRCPFRSEEHTSELQSQR